MKRTQKEVYALNRLSDSPLGSFRPASLYTKDLEDVAVPQSDSQRDERDVATRNDEDR